MRSNLEKEDQKFEKCEGVSKVLGDICNTITKINEKDAKTMKMVELKRVKIQRLCCPVLKNSLS